MPNRILVVQHTAFEGLGAFGPWLAERGMGIETIAHDAPVPSGAADRADGLIVLGGPMGVQDTNRYPRLRDEAKLIEAALARNAPVLGICLGSQLLASVLGARVQRAKGKEIGWGAVSLEVAAAKDALFGTAPPSFFALHWHGDAFELPARAISLAKSAVTEVQGFAYEGRAWGLLFHLEADENQVVAMADAFPDELAEVGLPRATLLAGISRHRDEMRRVGSLVLGRWLDVVERS